MPFNELGFGIFTYYGYWFKWTLLTLPMGFIGYYMKKDKWWSVLILTFGLLFLGIASYYNYLVETLHSFPYHLLTTLFCLITMLIYPLFIFNDIKNKKVSFIISVIIIIALIILAFANQKTYNSTLLVSDSTMALHLTKNTTYI